MARSVGNEASDPYSHAIGPLITSARRLLADEAARFQALALCAEAKQNFPAGRNIPVPAQSGRLENREILNMGGIPEIDHLAFDLDPDLPWYGSCRGIADPHIHAIAGAPIRTGELGDPEPCGGQVEFIVVAG